MIVGTGKSEICSAVWRQNSFFLGGHQYSYLRPSTNWMRPTHIMEGNLLYSKPTDLNVYNIFKKSLHSNI